MQPTKQRGRRDDSVDWRPEMDALLGTAPDAAVAVRLGVGEGAVRRRRGKLGIRSHRGETGYSENYPGDDDLVALMEEHGTWSSAAGAVGVSRKALRSYASHRAELERRLLAGLQPRLTPERRAENQRRATRVWRANNPERTRRHRRDWYHTERGKAQRVLARSRRRGADGDEAAVEYIGVLQQDPCSYCGEQGGTVDHIVPIVEGGLTLVENLTAACRSCNCKKQDTSLLEFIAA